MDARPDDRPVVLSISGSLNGALLTARLVARMVEEDGRTAVVADETAEPRAVDADVVILTPHAHVGDVAPRALAVLDVGAGDPLDTAFSAATRLAASGRLVLDADDARILERGRRAHAVPFWVSLDANHAEILATADAGGDTAFVEDGTLFFLRGHLHEALISETRMPIAQGRDDRRNTTRALVAAALASCAGVSNDAIAAGLERHTEVGTEA